MKIETIWNWVDLKATMVQIFEVENKKTLSEIKDIRNFENRVWIMKINLILKKD